VGVKNDPPYVVGIFCGLFVYLCIFIDYEVYRLL